MTIHKVEISIAIRELSSLSISYAFMYVFIEPHFHALISREKEGRESEREAECVNENE
jgi:hypothetical protein